MIAVVYYSMGGNVRYAAEKIAKQTGAELIPIEPEKTYPDKGAAKFFWGGKSAVMGESPQLKAYTFDASKYDRIILGTPVWAGTFAPPLRTFAAQNKAAVSGKKISVFACSSGGNAQKAIDRLRALLGADKLEATLSLVDPLDKPSEENEKKIKGFCAAVTL